MCRRANAAETSGVPVADDLLVVATDGRFGGRGRVRRTPHLIAALTDAHRVVAIERFEVERTSPDGVRKGSFSPSIDGDQWLHFISKCKCAYATSPWRNSGHLVESKESARFGKSACRAERCPIAHQHSALLEEITTGVRRFSLVFHCVGECSLGDFTRVIRAFACPVAER